MVLLLASPLMRGGHLHVALIALELLGLVILVALWARALLVWRDARILPNPWVLALALTPLLLALLQLTPLPPELWSRLAPRSMYLEPLRNVGLAEGAWRALSISPDATATSLLAGIPIVAAFLVGHFASLHQLRTLLRCVVALAFAEVLLGLMQFSGGEHSPFFFGVLSYGPPVGSWTNRNHFANYLAMALAAYVWLAYEAVRYSPQREALGPRPKSFTTRHAIAVWMAGGLVLVLGVLMSRSRGGALFGLSAAFVALGVVALRSHGWSRGMRLAIPLAAVVVVGAGALLGVDTLVSRLSAEQLASSASFRSELVRSSLQVAWTFWPWGSGWGTYDLAYQPFQPISLAVYVNHAHMDYAEMLLEGGVFFLLPAGLFLWLAVRRALDLLRTARRARTLDREAMAAVICGVGLLGLLLHSLVEFNMRIPANAILGALLAGAYLRPLSVRGPADD